MMQLEFRFEDEEALAFERFHHPHPHVQRKMWVLWLKSLGLGHHLICLICGISPNTLRQYFREYQEGGVERLKELCFYRPASALDAQADSVEAALREQPPHSVREACARIAALTGIRRGLSQVRRWIRGLGLRYRKVGMIPAKADVQAQAAYRVGKLEPALRQAQAGQRKVFFVDAAHFVLGPVLGYVWSVVRIMIKAPAGRQRFNVLGALDAITHQVTLVCNDTYITAASVCQLLRELAGAAGGLPVSVVLDNARYQRCRMVEELAAQLGIELLFLPPYSPNLNLIERLWKFTKKECLASEYYENFALFKQAIHDFLQTLHQQHRAELNSLLTFNFQQFENAQSMAA